MSFEHPGSWIERKQQFMQGTMGGPILLLTTYPPAASLCYERRAGGSVESGCDENRLGALRPGGVAFFVSQGADLSLAGRPQPSPPDRTIDGYPAWETHDVRGSCGTALAADQAVQVRVNVVNASGRGWLYFSACTQQVPTLEAIMQRLLASVRVKTA